LGNDALLEAGLLSFIKECTGCDAKLLPFTTSAALASELTTYAPQVLIVQHSLFVENLSELAGVLSHFSQIRIITLSLQDNNVHVYDKRQLTVSQPYDLLLAL